MKTLAAIARGSLALLAASASMAVLGDDALGRLFLTPERRAALDRQRQFNIQETQTLQGATVSLDGVIRRSDGDRTLWINGRAQHNAEGGSGVNAVLAPNDASRATIQAEGEAPANLKVGESMNRATREKQGGLGNGTLSVGKPAPRK